MNERFWAWWSTSQVTAIIEGVVVGLLFLTPFAIVVWAFWL